MANSNKAPLSPWELSGFCSQMAMIIKAGIPLSDGLDIMKKDAVSVEDQEILKIMIDSLDMGDPISTAFEKALVFPAYFIDMVKVGHISGKLDEVFDSLAIYYEREQNMRASIKNAVTYPLIMLSMMLLVMAVLSIKVLPIFAQVYEQLGASVSAFAAGVMRTGSTIGIASIGLLIAIIIICTVLVAMSFTQKGKKYLDSLFAVLPLTGRLSEKIAISRFSSSMSLMLSSGLDSDESIKLAAPLVTHPRVKGKIAACQELINGGKSFSEAIFASKIFPGVFAQMIAVGFKTGTVEQVMEKMAVKCEEEIEESISDIIGILEPTLVGALAVAVGMILLSVMLPLLGIMSTLG